MTTTEGPSSSSRRHGARTGAGADGTKTAAAGYDTEVSEEGGATEDMYEATEEEDQGGDGAATSAVAKRRSDKGS
eukprot:CAMPEP_0183293034 /NCGR_PEP_ID=MMETSP0160_2-20130417/1887_1 /TAXON_ID=2839 ORGANISM="Odontella Sinensis, Strain Grunow 1884" /NCGR_SAMPLE_ID=MMETSP0160_2 /ASSEMBLY_ACC=CAM_ASM_000250 /LENGTH=74 /DNA_ID=CAMNT_0025454091 /DNA_START=7 /DNA_END=228 /DNA_ORIENTATION=+